MALTKHLARGFVFEVESAVANTWIQIGGVNSFEVGRDKESADTTDFASAGNAEHLPAQRSGALTVEGFFLEDLVSAPAGARDPGQERCEVLSDLVGVGGVGRARYKTPANKIKHFSCSVNVTGPGGSNNDAASWSAEFERSGAVTTT